MDPNFLPGRLVLGQAYEQKGVLREAVAELERAVSLSGGSPVYLASLAHAYGAAGQRAPAQRIFADLTRMAQQKYVPAYDLALASVGLGETSQIVALLERATEERSPRAAFLNIEPRFDAIRSHPRFLELIAPLHFP